MHELFSELLPYLLILYLIDGVTLCAVGQVYLMTAWGRHFRRLGWDSFVSNAWPLGQLIVADDLLCIPVPTGLYAFAPGVGHQEGRYQLADFGFTDYAVIRTVEADGNKIKVNQQTLYTAATPRHAQRLVALIRTVKELPVEQRGAVINQYSAARADVEGVRTLHTTTQEAVVPLRAFCLLLFVAIFGLLPLALYGDRWLSLPLAPVIQLLGVSYLACLLLTLYLHRLLHQTTWSAALSEYMGLIFSPVSAIRALAHLTRNLYADYEALTVAAVLLPMPAFCQQVRQELHRAARLKSLSACTDWVEFWTMRQQMVETLAAQCGMTHEIIFAAPLQQDSSAAAYCPVCHDEFRTGFTRCPDCDVTLQCFAVT